MKSKKLIHVLVYVLVPICFFCQGNYPWNNPLRMAWSNNGITFNNSQIFQDSSGVPCVVRWNGDTLIAAFQWFRQPNPSASWDRVATKFSYDNGITWTSPTPIIVNGLPANFQRPFDPTLTVFSKDSIRIYFSSSKGIPMMGLDSSINTFSAKSADGINFYFEPKTRVDQQLNKVIDPAVIYFNNSWHYLAPIGTPQQGAYHYVSPDGINFSIVQNIPSDNSHNWTGNYMVENISEARFYGCGGQSIWYNSTSNGGVWSGFVSTNIQGGDPSVLKISTNNYLMVYVVQPYATGIVGVDSDLNIKIFPNPASNQIEVNVNENLVGSVYTISDHLGKVVLTGKISSENTSIEVGAFAAGLYHFSIGKNQRQTFKVLKE